MKRIFKLIVNVMAIALFSMCAFSFTGCKNTSIVEVEFSIYNNTTDSFYSKEEVTMTIELYDRLAPKTVEAIKGYVNEGYFNNAFIYQLVNEYDYQYMFGDLEFDNEGNIVQKSIKPMLPGEFYSNGVTGNNIEATKGSIGLWRSVYARDGVFNVSSEARNSGRATLFMPTSTNRSLEGYVCLFAKYDVDKTEHQTILSALETIFGNESYFDTYVIYYTGEYDASKENDNFGLTFNCVLQEEFDENEIENLFEAEGQQYTSFNHYTIRVAKNVGGVSENTAKIKTAKIK